MSRRKEHYYFSFTFIIMVLFGKKLYQIKRNKWFRNWLNKLDIKLSSLSIYIIFDSLFYFPDLYTVSEHYRSV